tara:strand:- start:18554 stop:21013 length:2460 start_codon:yes stop_codon:yes gene_type:complete
MPDDEGVCQGWDRASTLELQEALAAAGTRELALLGELERQFVDSERAKSHLLKFQRGVRFRLGHAIIQNAHPVRLLKLPLALAKLARSVLRERKNTAAGRIEKIVPSALGGAAQAFVNRAPRLWTLPVQGERTFAIRGSIDTARSSKERGVLLLVQFSDAQGSTIRFEDQLFVWSQVKRSSTCFLQTGRQAEFSVAVFAPPDAVEMTVGFERFTETPPIHLKLRSVAEIEQSDSSVSSFGATRGSNVAMFTPSMMGDDAVDRPTFGAILDEFTRDCLSPDLELILVSRAGWRDEFQERTPYAFFAESAWRGNQGQWNYAMTKPRKWGKELVEILAWCRDNEVPSVFWNKEDPVNFEVFKSTAAKFDHIFTTDCGSVDAYKRYAGHDNVHALQFAAQPLLHNPIRPAAQIERIAFTGSWRGIKYPKRAEWLDSLLSPVMEQGLLDIFDRYADEVDNPDLIFPEKFRGSLRGALPYERLVTDIYKRHMAFINVNSVEESDTMLARRVFEILACGAPVISSPSPAIEKTFGDVVISAHSSSDVAEAVDRLRNEPFYREHLAVRGVRLVHSEHTYRHRLEQVSKTIGKPLVLRKPKKVSILCCSKRPEFLNQIARQVKEQLYEDTEIIFVAHAPAFSDDQIAEAFSGDVKLKILKIGPEKVLADGLNAAMAAADGDYFAKFDDDDYYGRNYLKDAMLAFDYAPDVGVVGKQSFFAFLQNQNRTVQRFPGKSYCFTSRVHGGTLLWSRSKTEGIAFTPVRQGTDTLFLTACRELEVPVFSSDPFNFVHVRYADAGQHTWKISDREFSQKATLVGEGMPRDRVFL